MSGQRPTCAVCDHHAGAPTAPLRRPAYRDGRYLCPEHAVAPERQAPGAVEGHAEQATDELLEAHLRRHPPQQRAARAAPPQTTAPPGRIPQGDAALRLPRTAASVQPHQGTGDPRGRGPAQGTERALAPTQGTRARPPRHVPSPSHPAPPAQPAPPAPPPRATIVEAPPQVAPAAPAEGDVPPAPHVPPPQGDGPVVG